MILKNQSNPEKQNCKHGECKFVDFKTYYELQELKRYNNGKNINSWINGTEYKTHKLKQTYIVK